MSWVLSHPVRLQELLLCVIYIRIPSRSPSRGAGDPGRSGAAGVIASRTCRSELPDGEPKLNGLIVGKALFYIANRCTTSDPGPSAQERLRRSATAYSTACEDNLLNLTASNFARLAQLRGQALPEARWHSGAPSHGGDYHSYGRSAGELAG